jgi:quercetin dioxygenase-like cupin family protein
MPTIDDCKRNAERCLRWADEAANNEQRDTLLEIAGLWTQMELCADPNKVEGGSPGRKVFRDANGVAQAAGSEDQHNEGTTMAHASSQVAATIPADNPERDFTLVRSDSANLPHIGLVGDTYTILVSGKDTAGRYCLIDMHIPPGGGPPPHRHDFEEMFSILEGEIEATFRGRKTIIRSGDTVNIPANAPHQFQNKSEQPARLLCLCSPAGQEEFFKEVGVSVATRTTPPTPLDEDAEAAFIAKVKALAPKYRTTLLPPQAGG